MSAEGSVPRGRLDRLYSPPEIGGPGKRRARAQRRDLLLAGGFVLAMAAFAVGAFYLLLPTLFGRAYHLDAYFLDAAGLDAGIQVVQEGYVIGMVERVRPLFPNRDAEAVHCPQPAEGSPRRHPSLPCFRARLRIRDDWPVPRDSQVQLGAAGMLQGDVIKITPGEESDLFEDGAIIAAAGREVDLAGRLGDLTQTIEILVEETIAPTLASVRDQIKTIETLIGTGEDQSGNQERLAGAFTNLQLLSERLKQSVDPEAIAAILQSVRVMSDNLAGMTSELSSSTDEIQGAVTNYGELATEIRGLVRENRPALQESLDDTQYLLQEISAALTPILSNIEEATRNLSALSRELRQDPKTLLKSREREDRTPWFE
ncbi:MlaD family protein [Imhoffiella purpurea]|uniref:ABC-type transport system involved in resistance to organic solvents, periplasmic component n=1 Tax=Imhoffiella purpurea TaxID=1249627 RepID=W9VC63_9GAMM|nr:MlaD family protein [Imhoffiella purpurea]EXJ17178.1 ABC-type transport system involved in resistance to organic solvents, periplasmic component [Imhoffiella purpurea]